MKTRNTSAVAGILLCLVIGVAPAWGAQAEVQGAPAIHGMITVSYANASDSAGPRTEGLRIGYGYRGGAANDYPWGEYWVTFREKGTFDITAAGLSVVPVAMTRERFGVGFLLDLGFSRRRIGNRTVLAGMFGTGFEASIRLSRRWDLVPTAEAVYRTTSDVELQARVGMRFHSKRIPSIMRGSNKN